MRSARDEDESKTEQTAVAPTVDPPKKKSVEERLDDLEKRLVPIIGPTPKGE